MLSEVSALPARVLLEMAVSAGIDPAPLVAAAGLDANTLRRARRIGWGAYCELIERLEVACGGPAPFDALVLKSYHASMPSELQWVGHAFVSPGALVRTIFEVIHPALFPTLDFSVESLTAERLEVTGRLKQGARACTPFFRAMLGALRTLTSHAGLAPAEVEVRELGAHALVAVVTLPADVPGRAGDPELARCSQELVRYFATEVRVLDATVQAQAGIIADIGALGRELARHLELEPLALALLEVLGKLGFADRALHVMPLSGAKRVWQKSIAAATPTRVFALAGKDGEIGQLEVGGAGEMHTLEQLIPWIALVIDTARRGRRPAEPEEGVPSRMARVERSLRLTARQAEVLALVVQGRSNKEIAALLACAENTVEFHVTQLLKKAGAATRTLLVAQFWTGALSVQRP